MGFGEQLILWYKNSQRNLPWRSTSDPYLIWLSEVILQQTKVEQGLPYYLAFANRFPTIASLAQAPEDEVLKLWQGLGYYSRARNLHKAAKMVVTDYNGTFPSTYHNLLKLPGIGPYTAAAISSICFNEVQTVVDGNVFRVLSRLFGIDKPIDTSGGAKLFRELADELIVASEPGNFNQALMEFGATICTPTTPKCDSCAFSQKCIALAENQVNILPVKRGKPKVKVQYINYLVIFYRKKVLVHKRLQPGIWQNLHDFPHLTGQKAISERAVLESDLLRVIVNDASILAVSKTAYYKHILTHRLIRARFWELTTKVKPIVPENCFLIGLDQYETLAIPRLVEKYWNDKSAATS